MEKIREDFNPLVSIIIPVYNGANYMREAIDSALAQTYKNIEIIVVNDGSTDNTDEIARSYGDKIRYFKKGNGGVATALNLAIEKSQGEYISWLSHDDMYYPDKVEIQINELSKDKNKSTIIYGNLEYINGNSEFLWEEQLQKKHKNKFLNSSLYPILCGILHGCTLLIKRTIFFEFGLFKENLKTTQDYDLFFDILKRYPIKHTKKVLIKSRDHAEQGSKALNSIHVLESEKLWTKIINSLTTEDLTNISESPFEFFMKLSKRMKLLGCYDSAKLAFLRGISLNTNKKNILFTTANMRGGLGRYSQELSDELSNKYNVFLFVVENGNKILLQYQGYSIFEWEINSPILFKEMFSPSKIDFILRDILPALRIDLVHINGFLLFGFSFIKTVRKYNIPIIYTAHDFHLICLSQHLIDNKNKHCNICKFGYESPNCLKNNFFSDMFGKLDARKLNLYRKYVKNNVIPNLDLIIYPTNFCKKTLQDFYPELMQRKAEVISHGITIDCKWKKDRVSQNNKIINIGIIGSINIHKGLDVVKKLTNSMSASKFHFNLFGSTPGLNLKNTTSFGEYDFREIVNVLQESSVDLMLIISECPETFSYTISECINARIPIITNGVGAQAERVRERDAGWVIDQPDIYKNIVRLLESIYKDRGILQEKQERMSLIKTESVEQMCSNYIDVYERLINSSDRYDENITIGSINNLFVKEENLFYSDNLQISDNDLVGNKFNGHDLHLYLRENNIDSRQMVWNKESNDLNTFIIARNNIKRGEVFRFTKFIQNIYSLNGVLNPLGYEILSDPLFLNTKFVHFHLVHNNIFDIQLLPLMTRLKPIVWTVHDPWILGGHCIHHFDCNKWETQCGDCPYLDKHFPIMKDNSALNFALKKDAIQNSKFDIIVASRWMEEKLKKSPILKEKNIHIIPFGINQNIFKPINKNEVRKKLGISNDALVISFRCDYSGFKGMDFIENVLGNIRSKNKIVLLVLANKLRRKYKNFQIKEYGWVKNDKLLTQIYSASDLFLMPSTVESFGMMSIEVMSCGTLPIVLDGTALPDTVNAPGCGVSTRRDKKEYLKTVQYFIDHESERLERAKKCLEFAKSNYNKDIYVKKIIKVYDKVLKEYNISEEDQYLLDQLKKNVSSNNYLNFENLEKKNFIESKADLIKHYAQLLFTRYKNIIPKKIRIFVKNIINNVF